MIVYTGGTFDVLHVGHIDLLNWCRVLAGKDGQVVVALNTDEFIHRYKGTPPVMTYDERKAVLLALRGIVDRVVANMNGEDSKPTILSVEPDIIAIGSDWLRKNYMEQMKFSPNWLEEQRIALVYVPRHISMSSTLIKQRIRGRE